MKTTRTSFALVICLLAVSLPLGVLNAGEDLSRLVDKALADNPNLATWRARVAAAELAVPQAGAWSDPFVSLAVMNLPVSSFDFNQLSMTGSWLTVTQAIPLSNRYQLQEDIARNQLEQTLAGSELRELEIRRLVTSAWYDWKHQLAATATLDSMAAIVDDLLRIARSRYETGRGHQRDILRMEAEYTRLMAKRTALQQQELAIARRLAVLCGDEPDDLPSPPVASLPSFFPLDRAEMEQQLLEHNPHLQQVAIERNLAEIRTEMARRRWWPDLKVSLGYGWRQTAPDGTTRSDLFTVMVGTAIPLHGKKLRAAVEESLTRRQQAESSQVTIRRELQLQLARLLDKDERLDEQITLFRQGVELQLETAGKAAMMAWMTAEGGIEALLGDRRSLLEAQLERLALERDRLKLRASLAALLAADIGMKPEGLML